MSEMPLPPPLEDAATQERAAKHDQVLMLRRAGTSFREIAKRVGYSLSTVQEICARAGVEQDEQGPSLTRAQRRALASGGPEGELLRQQNAAVVAVSLQAQEAEGEVRLLRAEREKERLAAGAGEGGALSSLLSQFSLMQQQQQLHFQSFQAQVQQQLQAMQAQLERQTTPGARADPYADFARTFKDVLGLADQLRPAPLAPVQNADQFERAERIRAEMELRRDELDLRREQWQQEQALRLEDYQSKKAMRERIAANIQEHTPLVADLVTKLFIKQPSPTPTPPEPLPSIQLPCPSCGSVIQIAPSSAGPTRWQRPACRAVLRHASSTATAFELAPPGANLEPASESDLPSAPALNLPSQAYVAGLAEARHPRLTQGGPSGQPPGPPATGYVVGDPATLTAQMTARAQAAQEARIAASGNGHATLPGS